MDRILCSQCGAIVRPCLVCGRLFHPTFDRLMCCSHSCANRHTARVRFAHNQQQRDARRRCRAPVTCRNCGTTSTTPYQRVYCSERCGVEFRSRQQCDQRRRSPRRFRCQWCNVEVAADYPDKRRRFCGVRCARRFRELCTRLGWPFKMPMPPDFVRAQRAYGQAKWLLNDPRNFHRYHDEVAVK